MTALEFPGPQGPLRALHDGPTGGPILAIAHGAGGGIEDDLLTGFAAALADRDVGCLRFTFAYRAAGRRAPDREPLLREAWLAGFEHAAGLGDPVWAGGKSMGGRIASMCVADGMLAAGLVFIGYPLHPPGRPERIRDAHLPRIEVPMLFLQGTADAFARQDLLHSTLDRLGERAALHEIEGGDHSFRIRGRPKDDAGMGRRLGEIAARFIREPR